MGDVCFHQKSHKNIDSLVGIVNKNLQPAAGLISLAQSLCSGNKKHQPAAQKLTNKHVISHLFYTKSSVSGYVLFFSQVQ